MAVDIFLSDILVVLKNSLVFDGGKITICSVNYRDRDLN
ncbi:hypothetical protein YPPY13_1608 [Yersinia pestis PY-13]|uniref:Uncharacterized protein n=3 Tax=Yersinia pseudotuberculosis complex TaxID=1649845 RepID=A0A0U1QYP6_YERP3|nr:hypothetical protein YpsIP31758_2654 [Yersinia pseudotuberculosis IP 31758]ABX88445.1 hypothetical protein YpAngola_A1553 [Yersinia pestis Angola]ADV99396.1 hypothetical protein YPC_2865 [Yersinia pestis biovar Medievalis str. Harbin 35]EDR34441.1 hypothetical protein YPIP275_4720 [Yersinia pestis biovar Orientalis str. IP275]EDR40548.1 hypothetical protein YpF1991016_0353 [Yersinia pestis biovar Orientalis str. F1991016]EDR43593.1 hypothetical protein YpE1979001_2582 [Yersinia pestis biova